MSRLLPLLIKAEDLRSERDRAELLTALLNAPSVDDFYRGRDLIVIPADHPQFGWGCAVPECVAATPSGQIYCRKHNLEWSARGPGVTRVSFAAAATPITKRVGVSAGRCIVCPNRPAMTGDRKGLCKRHWTSWSRWDLKSPDCEFARWVGAQEPFRGFGDCEVGPCHELAEGPLGLCENHRRYYKSDGEPGRAHLPEGWFRTLEPQGLPVTRIVEDEAAWTEWLRRQRWMHRRGLLNLRGCHPLVKLEFAWGLWNHSQKQQPSRWTYPGMQGFLTRCQQTGVSTVFELLQPERLPPSNSELHSHQRMILREITDGLRCIYYSPADAREAGFLETQHFGRTFPQTRGHFDLTGVPQRWLRDLIWDDMAERLQSPASPRRRGQFDALRRASIELGAFLEIDAPQAGHDPTLLFAEHAQRFAADQRLRAANGLPSLGISAIGGGPGVVTEVTRRIVFNAIRAAALRALKSGRTEQIGLNTSFVTALPAGGHDQKRSRTPFTDEMARALADSDNLQRLADDYDSFDRGARDIWEAIVLTGRRSQEILGLRLDCIGRHNGLPLLWHDQTKVGRYDQAIRIPERLYERLDARRTITLARFHERVGREPTTAERDRIALFATHIRNANFEKAISYTFFYTAFKGWVDSLEMGPAVVHQARHTMATRLLDAGASLAHIRQYLGQVSDRMAEHYAHVSSKSLEGVLSTVWVSGPGSQEPGTLLTSQQRPLSKAEATALALDLTRRSTPTEGGICTFQPVVNGSSCPWKLNCAGCDHFVLSGADLLYWRRKQEQWRILAEQAPDPSTADYLDEGFDPTARAIAGLERALSGLGLLDQALSLDMRRPQDYFGRVWSTAFSAAELTTLIESDHHGAPASETSLH